MGRFTAWVLSLSNGRQLAFLVAVALGLALPFALFGASLVWAVGAQLAVTAACLAVALAPSHRHGGGGVP